VHATSNRLSSNSNVKLQLHCPGVDTTSSSAKQLNVLLMINPLSAGFTATVWPTAAPVGPTGQLYNSTTTFYVVANMGVILFMFLLGCELDQTLLARQWRRSAPIALSAIMFPFGVGAAASVWLEVRTMLQGDACLVARTCVKVAAEVANNQSFGQTAVRGGTGMPAGSPE
jgi:predicted permease